MSALDAADDRIAEYEEAGLRYYRPTLFVMTDGYATDEELEEAAVTRMRQYIQSRRINCIPIAVGHADTNRLAILILDKIL